MAEIKGQCCENSVALYHMIYLKIRSKGTVLREKCGVLSHDIFKDKVKRDSRSLTEDRPNV